MTMAAKRLEYIETMRGLACILIVSWHVVGMDYFDGLELPMSHPLHTFGNFFLPLRMPLFAFISGYVFNAAVGSLGDVGEKIRTKARRLLVPLLVVGGIHFTLRALAYHEPLTGIWHVYLDLYGHFWYLNAAFVLMSVGLAVVFLTGGRERLAAVGLLALACGLYVMDIELHPINWFAITKATYIGPFFFLGQVFRTERWEKALHAPGLRRTLILSALAFLVVVLYYFRQTGPYLERVSADIQTPQSLVLSMALVALLFGLRWENRWLALLGPYSYAIFLFHVIFTGATRMVEQRLFPGESVYLMYAAGLAVGLAAPIVIAKLLERGPPILHTLFLGVRYAPRPRGAQAAAPPAAAGP